MSDESEERLLADQWVSDEIRIDCVLDVGLCFDCFTKMMAFIELREGLLGFRKLGMKELMCSNEIW